MRLPDHRLDQFRLFAPSDPHDPAFPSWSRCYEWHFVLQALAGGRAGMGAEARALTVHNTCCGHLDGHALFHDRLIALCPRTVNSDLHPRGRNPAFRGFFRQDVREPLDRRFDRVLCISTLEEIYRDERDPVVVRQVLANLLGQVEVGGRLIVTCDISTPDKPVFDISGALEIELLEGLLGARCAVPPVRLTGASSVFPEPLYADLSVCLIECTRR